MKRALAASVAVVLGALMLLPSTATAGPRVFEGSRVVTFDNDVSIEKVATDGIFPFDEPESGEAVFFRIRATSEGPATARRGEINIGAVVSEQPTIRGRSGLRCGIDGPGLGGLWTVVCANTRVLRDGDSVSVLLRVEAADRRVSVVSLVTKAPNAKLVVRSKKDRASIAVESPAPWSGSWRWDATWAPANSFTGQGMLIGQKGNTACSTWSWSSGGKAKGTVTGNTWEADWRDGFGEGTWTLTLEPGGDRFTGTQRIDPYGSVPPFTAQITGDRTTGPGPSIDCSTITLRATPPGRR